MFPSYEDKAVDRIGRLQGQLDLLLDQKERVKKDKLLGHGYSIAIGQILSAINQMAKELQKEPTDGNQ